MKMNKNTLLVLLAAPFAVVTLVYILLQSFDILWLPTIVLIPFLLVPSVITMLIYRLVQSSKKRSQECKQQKQDISNMSGSEQPGNSPKPSFAQDSPSFGLAIVGFLFPLIGAIMYIVWLSPLPFRARSAGKGALIGVIVSLVSTVVIYIYTITAFN